MKATPLIGALLVWTVVGASAPATAQSVAARSPNVAGAWTARRGVVQFNFLHRFSLSPAPLRKLTNTPTFNVGTGITDNLMIGLVYGSNSSLVPAYPNEWEFHARALPLSEGRGSPLDVAIQAGYNLASESVDGELLLARGFGRLRLLAAGRAFARAYSGTEARFAIAAGAAVRLTPNVSVAGDWGSLLDRESHEPLAWSAGLQLGVPYTPHSFSVHASNVGTASLEGASRGTRTRWGFEYTVPITLRRYGGAGAGGDGAERAGRAMRGDTVFVDIRNLTYGMEHLEVDVGTTVVWRNRDPVQHSVVADDGAFASELIDPDGSFAFTFMQAGDHTYHCTPHPFMKGTVTVRETMNTHPPATGREEKTP